MFLGVFVISHVLEHGGDNVLGSFCYSPRARTSYGPDEGAEAGTTPGGEGTPPVPEGGPSKEGVPSTAARVAMEMRAVVKGRRAA